MTNKKQPVIVDTNVICLAGNTNYQEMPPLLAACALKCTLFINEFIKNKNSKIVLDIGREIIGEYERNIPKQPTVSRVFMKWLYQYLAKMSAEDLQDLIKLEKDSQGAYLDFPKDPRLGKFDPADRKYIALANAHKGHPEIIQGTDCKWWGFRDILLENGIRVTFLCEEYVKANYHLKIEG
jgi:hypothetical protein